MTDDYIVARRSQAWLREDAISYPKLFVNADRAMVDIVAMLDEGRIDTVKGRRLLRLKKGVDEAGTDALTSFVGDEVEIQVAPSVLSGARFGNGRARFTLAHEFAHARLHHDKAPMARRVGANKFSHRPKFIDTSQSAEWQANEWASYLLMRDETVRQSATPEELAIRCGTSVELSKIRFERCASERMRQASMPGMMRKFAELKSELSPRTAQKKQYVSGLCCQCSQAKLIPIGVKFLCENCSAVMDNYQDGDTHDS